MTSVMPSSLSFNRASSMRCSYSALVPSFTRTLIIGSGERGTGNGERGAGNGKRGAGNGERATGNGKRGTGSGEQGTGMD